MTTGSPIYLVTACTSPEEFVAAFRRYADRAGLFVPSATPLPSAKRGRIALTLADGGVMIEGEVEVLQSSPKPQGLHGRAGMTVKFVDLDEASRTVLGELEKARLAMKPAPPSVAPRPAQVPAEPRAVPPKPGGRIDAANALAECVVIGDLGALREMGAAPKPAADPGSGGVPRAGQKFVIPSIPGPGGRPKTPTAPPEAARPKTPTAPPEAARPKTPTSPPEAARPKTPTAPPEAARPKTPTAPPEAAGPKATTFGMPPLQRAPAPAAPPAAAKPEPAPATAAAKPEPAPAPTAAKPATTAPKPGGSGTHKPTMLGVPVMRPMTQPFGVPAATPSADGSGQRVVPPRRAHTPSTPPMPRNPTPVAPLPIARPPAASPSPAAPEPPSPGAAAAAVEADLAEKTDLSAIPLAAPPPEVAPAPTPPTSRSGGMRASEIMAAIPTEDWTMTPDASAPTVLPPTPAPPLVVEAKTPPKGPPTGDWTMTADPSAADGWTPPSKLDRAKQVPAPTSSPATGNPVKSLPEKALEAVAWEDKPTSIGEKVEIDPSLMEPDAPVQDVALAATLPPGAAAPPPLAAMPPPLAAMPPPLAGMAPPPLAAMPPPPLAAMPPRPPMPGTFAPPPIPGMAMPPPFPNPLAAPAHPSYPPARQITDAGTGFFRDSEQVPRYPSEQVSALEKTRHKRVLVIAIVAALAVLGLAIVIVMALGGKKHAPAARGSAAPTQKVVKLQPAPAGSAAPAAAGSAAPAPAGSAAPAPAGSQAEAVHAAEQPAQPSTCTVEVTTAPEGAEIEHDKKILGTSPGKFELPCGVAAKLTIRRARYLPVVKTVTPEAGGTKVEARLSRPTLAVKVTSIPSGATISIGGRMLGITPTTIHLPAFEASTITISKDGYATDVQHLMPRANNTVHHVRLVRSGARRR